MTRHQIEGIFKPEPHAKNRAVKCSHKGSNTSSVIYTVIPLSSEAVLRRFSPTMPLYSGGHFCLWGLIHYLGEQEKSCEGKGVCSFNALGLNEEVL